LIALDQLEDELWENSNPKEICPHAFKDSKGSYCGKDLGPEEKISSYRRMVCGVLSIQLWCLRKDHVKCITFTGEYKFPPTELDIHDSGKTLQDD